MSKAIEITTYGIWETTRHFVCRISPLNSNTLLQSMFLVSPNSEQLSNLTDVFFGGTRRINSTLTDDFSVVRVNPFCIAAELEARERISHTRSFIPQDSGPRNEIAKSGERNPRRNGPLNSLVESLFKPRVKSRIHCVRAGTGEISLVRSDQL